MSEILQKHQQPVSKFEDAEEDERQQSMERGKVRAASGAETPPATGVIDRRMNFYKIKAKSKRWLKSKSHIQTSFKI